MSGASMKVGHGTATRKNRIGNRKLGKQKGEIPDA
jgi:hypothetical protein